MTDRSFGILIELKDKFSKPLKGLSAPLEKTKKELKELQQAGKQLTWAERYTANLAKLSPKLEDTRRKVASLQDELDKTPAKLLNGDDSVVYAKKAAQLAKAKDQLAALEDKERTYTSQLQISKAALQKAGVETGDLTKARAKLTDQTDKARAANLRYKSGLDSLKKIQTDFRSGLVSLRNTALGATATFAGLGFAVGHVASDLMQQAKDLRVASAAFNISTESLQVWQMTGQQFNLEADKVRDIMKDVSDKIGDFSVTGGGEAKDIFEKLKLNIKDFKNLKPDEAILKIGQALDKSKLTQSEKIFLLEGLADDASLLLPMLDKNARALKDMQALASQTGVLMSDKDLATLKQSQEELKKIGMFWTGAKTRMGVAFAEIWNKSGAGKILEDWLKIGIEFAKWKMSSRDFQNWLHELPGNLKAGTANFIEFSKSAIELAGVISDGVVWLRDFAGGWKNLLIGFVAFKSIGMAASVLNVIRAFSGLSGVGALAAAGFGKLVAALGVVKRAMIVLSIVARANPIGLLVTAVVGAGILIYRNWDKIVSTFRSAKAKLSSMSWGEIAGAVVKGFIGLPHRLFKVGVNAMGELAVAILRSLGLPEKQARSVVTNTIAAFMALPGKMLDVGINAMKGLANGILQAGSEALASAKKIASDIADSVTGFFGIKSPSRLFMGYGRNLSEGLSIGITDQHKQAIAAARQLSDGVRRQMNTGVVVSLADARKAREQRSALPQRESLASVLTASRNAGNGSGQKQEVGGEIRVRIDAPAGYNTSAKVSKPAASKVAITANVGRASW